MVFDGSLVQRRPFFVEIIVIMLYLETYCARSGGKGCDVGMSDCQHAQSAIKIRYLRWW
jgi:hypothetical protein